ncbi:MAG TPA: hypothetical protein VIK79_13830 [Xanthobacteraceae bacterium]|jgi:hypothetical protein
MRTYIQYAVSAGAAVLVLATVVWANWNAVTTDAVSHHRPAAVSPHELMRGSTDLPVQNVRDPF